MKAGLNLFSVRDLLKDESSLKATCKQLMKDGYDFFQFSGMDFDAEMIKRVREELGTEFVLTHVPIDRVLNDTENLIKEHASFGCHNIGIGVMPGVEYEDFFYHGVKLLNDVGKIMVDNAAKFFYHAHHFEFMKLSNGQRRIDYMIENCPYINFTADTYWLQYGGANVCEYLEKMSGRIECIHLKDYEVARNEKGEWIVRMAPIGVGNLNFKDIIDTAKRCGTKYFLVEQDNASEHEAPLSQTKISIDCIKSWEE